jgi:hypothetical protein
MKRAVIPGERATRYRGPATKGERARPGTHIFECGGQSPPPERILDHRDEPHIAPTV